MLARRPRSGPGQLLLQLSLLLLQTGDPFLLRVAPWPPPWNAQPGQGAGVTGPAPVHDMAGVQALPAQHRTLLTVGRRVVGRQHRQLVLRGESPASGPLRHLRIWTFSTSAIHPPRICDPGRTVEHRHGHRHIGEVSIPALGSLIVRGASASAQVDREGRATNENTNGLLRQYFPKGSDLSVHSDADLDWVAAELNDRPRKRLDFRKPIEEIGDLLLR